MDKSIIDQINKTHIYRVDKLYRMYGGLASLLLDYEDHTLFMKIEVHARWPKDPVTTAVEIASKWRKLRPELAEARFYNTTIYFIDEEDKSGFGSPEAKADRYDVSDKFSQLTGHDDISSTVRIKVCGNIDHDVRYRWGAVDLQYRMDRGLLK